MGILLTSEEIEALSEWWLNAPEEVDWAETLNKAQLKKVVEWGDTGCSHQRVGLRKNCPTCWQSLKEEAGL